MTRLLPALVACVLLWAPAHVDASGRAAGKPRTAERTRFRFVKTDGRPPSREQKREVTRTLRDVDRLVERLGVTIPRVNISAGQAVDVTRQRGGITNPTKGAPRATFYRGTPQIRIGLTLEGPRGRAGRSSAMAVTVHEYGHLVFHQVATRRSRLYARRVARVQRESEVVDLVALSQLAGPYQELFADALAVLYFDSPDAIADPIQTTVGNAAFTELRDFGVRHTSIGVGETLRDQIDRSYGISAPIRTMIWSTYQQRLARGEADPRPAMLDALAHALIAELEGRLRTDRPIRSVERFNRDVRRRLRANPDFTGARG